MRILVTGATGLVGSHLVERLAARRHDIRVLVRSTSDLLRLRGLGLQLAYGDIRDYRAVRRAVEGIELVYHLAGLMRDWGPAQLFMDVNVGGAENVCRACVAAGVGRLVHISSVAATGMQDYPGIKDENAPLLTDPRRCHAYCYSKAEGERVVQRHVHRHGLQATILRPSYVYGPRELNVGIYIVARLLQRRFYLLPGNGRNIHQMIYATDVARGMELALQERAIGETYILTGPRTTAHEIYTALACALGRRGPIYVPRVVGAALGLVLNGLYKMTGARRAPLITPFRLGILAHNNAWDGSKAERELGFRYQVGLEEGMQTAVHWWRTHGYL
ncbi:MAG: NAD-dependent epimerase/dehydratase family protein [Chloroflexota bacterium]